MKLTLTGFTSKRKCVLQQVGLHSRCSIVRDKMAKGAGVATALGFLFWVVWILFKGKPYIPNVCLGRTGAGRVKPRVYIISYVPLPGWQH